jgi:hypothetical protein
MLYDSHWISFLNVANAALTAFVLRVAILARLLNQKRYLPGPPQMALCRWHDCHGCLWGLTAAGLQITANPGDHAFIAFVSSTSR